LLAVQNTLKIRINISEGWVEKSLNGRHIPLRLLDEEIQRLNYFQGLSIYASKAVNKSFH
jgi:hypothetical protein